ncbi:helix-turn-helix domain-containing protein [Amycolatopsis sp.]|uniref:AraC family transcriptional regulator n=1 Tax=Amycolatopsis sp. TaxID=37632 RepID=UPI002DFC31DC|nr:helix-turn-helix domain-containing protein [Amycolatopsis sp.]
MTPAPATQLPETGCATLWLWPGHAVYSGPSLDLGPHSGSVACLAVGLDDSFTVRTATEGGRPARTALIAPRVRHQLVAHGRQMIFCYLDPASARERQCRLRMSSGSESVRYDHTEEDALIANSPDPALHWLDIAGPAKHHVLDERIDAAARHLRERTNPAPGADELATRAGLSTSRFLHLFREHTGTSFRRYRLWARMLRAGTELAGGHDLTFAAAEAGFASPSHFSDSFHAMFGLRPSRLLATGVAIRPSPTD